MSDDIVIQVEKFGKRYKFGLAHHDRLADVITAGQTGREPAYGDCDKKRPRDLNPQSPICNPQSTDRNPKGHGADMVLPVHDCPRPAIRNQNHGRLAETRDL